MRHVGTSLLLAMAALSLSCASIPSLNEPALYSTYQKTVKGPEGERRVEAFVLHMARGYASDDSYVVTVERDLDATGDDAFALVLRHTGTVSESIESIYLKVDDREVELGDPDIERGFSGRLRSERVSAAIGGDALAALMSGSKLVVRYFGSYATRPIEVPEPGLEALKAFLGR